MQEDCVTSLQMDTRSSHQPRLFTALIFHYAVAALLLTHPHGGRSQQTGRPQPLMAMVVDDVTLPCHVKPAADAVNMMVEWSRPDLQPRFVHVRRSGEDRLIDQNPSYRGRTSVSIDGLKQGDMSLRLSKVKLSDEGTYRCYVPDLNIDSRVQLVVDVIKISKFSSGVLECKYRGSYPESEVSWLDSEGHVLSAGPTETVRGPDDLFTVSRNLTVEKRHSNSFTCRAQEKSTSQITEKHINVPDDFFPDSSGSSASVIIGFIVAIMVILALVFGVWKWRQHKSKAGNYNTDEEKGGKEKNSSISTESEQKSLMKADTNVENTGIMKNQNKVEERNYTEPSREETGLLCEVEEETQPGKLRTEGESDNDVIQKQSAHAGTGSHSVVEKGGQEHDLNKEATKPVSEETHTPGPSDPDTSRDKPEKNIDPNKGDEGTKSVDTGTEGLGLKDGGGQQQDTAGSGANTEDGNREQTQTAGQSHNKGGIQENDPPVKHDEDTSRPPEGVGQREKSRDSQDGGGDTTSTTDTHNTTSLETEAQSPDKKDEDKRTEDTEAKGNQKTTPDSGEGGDNTAPQSSVDRPPDHVIWTRSGADGQNDLGTKDEQTSSDPTRERQEDREKTGEENSSVSHETGSSAKTGTSV